MSFPSVTTTVGIDSEQQNIVCTSKLPQELPIRISGVTRSLPMGNPAILRRDGSFAG